MTMAHTVAYYVTAKVKAVNFFIELAHGGDIILLQCHNLQIVEPNLFKLKAV